MTEVESNAIPDPEAVPTGEADPGPEAEAPADEAPKGDKEARFRKERNEARAERDALAARVEALHRREIERLASGSLSHASDVFTLSGNDVADYLDDDGNVDADKVAADVAAILEERPGLRPPARPIDPTQGLGNGWPPKHEPKSLGDVLRF